MAAGGYEAWLAAALLETECRVAPAVSAPRRAEMALGPRERAAVALGHVVASLATEARVEAAIDALAAARGS
jgi:hypothetical protein